MKTTTFIAILLTLITLLLVTAAATFFLWQGHQDLRRDIQLQQSEIEGHTTTINDLQTTAAAREMALATGEAALATRDAELSESQAALATREGELAEALATLEVTVTPDATATTASESPVADGPPQVEIVYPTMGTIVTTDTRLPVIAMGFASEGITRMELVVGDRPPAEVTFDDGRTFYIFRRTALNLQEGTLFITATITTSENVTETTSVGITINGVEQEEGSTQGFYSAPPVAARPN